MQKYIHSTERFPELFEKLKYSTEKYGEPYTAIMFKLKDESRLNEFQEFLLKYLRITDTVFNISEKIILIILEETTLRGALSLNEKLREKIAEKWFSHKYYCASMQWDYIDYYQELLKSLKKRLKKAKECKTDDCVHGLSCAD